LLESVQVEWVLLSYRLPREPSTPRIALWRRLKKLGALPIGDGVAALPLDDRTREQFEWLADDVEQRGGEAVVWVAQPASRREQRSLERRLLEAVSADYERVAAAAAAAERHGPAALRRSVARLRRSLDEIRGRDYLGSPARRQAEAAVQRLAALEEVRR
jgi:hypothetical protein